MRIFWAVMILLVLGTVGFVIVSGGGGKPAEPTGTSAVAAEGDGGVATPAQAGESSREVPNGELAQQVQGGQPEPASEVTADTGVGATAEAEVEAPTAFEPAAAAASGAEQPVAETPAVVPGGASPETPAEAPTEAPVEAPVETPTAPAAATVVTGDGGGQRGAEAPAPEAAANLEVPGEALEAAGAVETEAPAAAAEEAATAPPTYVADATATRSGMGMLGNVINQASSSPGSDFIGRLAAAAAAYWSPAPDVIPAFEGATRAFRVTSGPSQLIVADDGKGNNVTVVIPRADVELVHTLLEQAAQLSLPAEDAAGSVPGEERFGVSVGGDPVGSLRLGPVPAALGIQGLALTFLADPVELPDPSAPAAVPEGPTYTLREDGAIELSNGTIIRGDGSAANPYAITWELLVSAERVYQPRNGLTALPDWCRALHEKHVRLTGHLLSPLMQDDTTQILLMRNQWDGCCIGVPPTPYDAVEVELSRPVSLVREQLNYGTITGIFEVDPYLVNNWLVGLWLLSEAKVEAANAQNWAVPAGVPN